MNNFRKSDVILHLERMLHLDYKLSNNILEVCEEIGLISDKWIPEVELPIGTNKKGVELNPTPLGGSNYTTTIKK